MSFALASVVACAVAASVQGAPITWLTGGSTAAASMVVATFSQAAAPGGVTSLKGSTVSYNLTGSGTGIGLVNGGVITASFADAAVVPPAGLFNFPVATGSIAIYVNSATAGLTATTALTTADLCAIFNDADTVGPTWDSLPSKPLGACTVNTDLVLAAVRTDSSGSTAVLANYLARSCPAVYPAYTAFLNKANPRAYNNGGAGCALTSGEVACIASAPNAVGYVVCGVSAPMVTEVALVNQVGNAIRCQTAQYTAITATPPSSLNVCTATWTSTVAMDSSPATFPLAYFLYAYVKPSAAGAQINAAKAYLGYLLKGSSSQTANFYYPLPANVAKLSACCVASLPTGTASIKCKSA